MVTIRQAVLDDKRAIFELLKIAYVGRWQYKLPARWEWMYQNNPFWTGERLPVWIAVDDETGQVVGQSCALVEPLYLNGEVYPVGWGVDFYVREEWRRQGIGARLQGANMAGHPVFMSLSMTPTSRAIKLKMGMQLLPEVPVYQRILHHDPDSLLETLITRWPNIENIAKVTKLHHLLARLFTQRESRYLPRNSGADSAPSIVEIHKFGEETDAMWAKIKDMYAGGIQQDAAFCNWKYFQQPDINYTCFQAVQDGEVCGHLVLRKGHSPERNLGILAKLTAQPDDNVTIRALVEHAILWFWQQKVIAVAAASSVPEIQEALTLTGFKLTKTMLPVIAFEGNVPETGWLLGRGDHDWDQYPLA